MDIDRQTAARIAWYHFQEGLTQGAIAEKLGLTRARVNQAIGEMRANGFIQVRIADPHGACVALEAELKEVFSLKAAVVVPAPGDETDVRRVTGLAAGHYVSDRLQDGQVLGLGWGGTLDAAATALDRRRGRGNTVVSLCGGFPRSTPVNPYDVAGRFARILDAECYYVTAPMFADNPEMRAALVASKAVRQVFDQVKKIDFLLLSAVDLTRKSRSVEYGLITDKLRRSLLAAGAVGDICGHYLDSEGRRIDHEINETLLVPELADLVAIPHIVLASGGAQKLPIIRAAIAARLCHTLITDEETGAAVLQG